VLHNISARYDEREIYTWVSSILTAINPFEPLPLYTDEEAAGLPSLPPRELPPHAFSVAEMACRGIARGKGSQAIIVSGESGAGKTFTMALVMSYITKRTRSGVSTGSEADVGVGRGLGRLLLQSNPVLEAFGNAATVRNHNSSRFGKFIRIFFDASGTRMVSMSLNTYLLEKVRVVSPSPNERTYHLFYSLVAGATRKGRPELAKRLALRPELTGANAHALIAATAGGGMGGVGADANAVAMAARLDGLCAAMDTLMVRGEQQLALLGIVAAVLHLRDVRFSALDDGCRVVGSASLAHAARLLGTDALALRLVQRVIHMGRGEPVTVSLTPEQAAAARDALCRAVYVAAFDHLTRRFNEAAAAISRSDDGHHRSTATPHGKEGRGIRATLSFTGGMRRSPVFGSQSPRAPKHAGKQVPPAAELLPPLPPSTLSSAHPLAKADGCPSPGSPISPASAETAALAVAPGPAPVSPSGGGGSAPNYSDTSFIALLDMFGFEIFGANSLEQLCINFANEKLQQYFLQCVFAAEEEVRATQRHARSRQYTA